jgi:hypothetical protein
MEEYYETVLNLITKRDGKTIYFTHDETEYMIDLDVENNNGLYQLHMIIYKDVCFVGKFRMLIQCCPDHNMETDTNFWQKKYQSREG